MQRLDAVFDLYEGAAKIFYNHFPTLVGLLLVLNAPLFILSEFLVPDYHGVSLPLLGFVPSFVLNSLVMAILSSIPAVSVIYLTAVAETNHKTGLKDTLISTFNKWLVAVLTMGISVLLIMIAGVLVIPGIIALIYLTFVEQVVVLEKKKFANALRSSYEIVKGKWWYVALVVLLIWFPNTVLAYAAYQGSYNILNALLHYHYFVPHILSTLIWYFGQISITLFYLRLKKIKE